MNHRMTLLFVFAVSIGFSVSIHSFVGARSYRAKKISCPANYLRVPALAGFTTSDFCIAKYEARQSGSIAISSSSGLPWVSINRADAQAACAANGARFSLPSNPQWQTVARNIADNGLNWSSGTAYSGTVNKGHDDNSPANAIEASADDNDPCINTGQTCDATTWNSQRRTHALLDGQIIWDLSGNVSEWTSTKSNTALATGYIHTFTSGLAQTNYGNDSFCGGSNCAYGYGYVAGTQQIIRGGNFFVSGSVGAGIFSADNGAAETTTNAKIGFRCVMSLD